MLGIIFALTPNTSADPVSCLDRPFPIPGLPYRTYPRKLSSSRPQITDFSSSAGAW